MKTYIVTREVILKYAHIFGVNPEEWKDGPPEVTYEATEVQSYIEDNEKGLCYETTFLDFDDLGGFKG